jgi:hypothetical protein
VGFSRETAAFAVMAIAERAVSAEIPRIPGYADIAGGLL